MLEKFKKWIRLFGVMLKKWIRILTVHRYWFYYWANEEIPLEDGSSASGWLMRRRDGDRIIYRRATEEEERHAEWFFAIRS